MGKDDASMSQDDTLSMIQRANKTHNFIANFDRAPTKLFISVQDKKTAKQYQN